jgi:hypothetical protein
MIAPRPREWFSSKVEEEMSRFDFWDTYSKASEALLRVKRESAIVTSRYS